MLVPPTTIAVFKDSRDLLKALTYQKSKTTMKRKADSCRKEKY